MDTDTAEGTRLLFATAARGKGRLSAILILLVVQGGASLAIPALLAAAVGAAVARAGVGRWVGLLGLVITASALTEAAVGVLASSSIGQGTAWLQVRTVRQLLRQGTRSSLAAGDACARVMQGAGNAAGLPSTAAIWLVTGLESATALVLLFLIDWRAGLALCLALPVALVLARRFVGNASAAQSAYFEAQATISARLLNALAGARTIRAAGTVATETDRVLVPLPALSSAGHQLWRVQRGVVWQFGLLLPLTEIAVLAVAGLGVGAGRTTAAQLLAVAGYLAIAMGALGQIDSLFEFAQARAGARRLAHILAGPVPSSGSRSRGAGPGAVGLRDIIVVREDGPVLDHLTLDIPAGRAMALVGRSGVGKSLVAALVGRLADPDAGVITLDGVPVQELATSELRHAVAYAFDQPALLGATVHDALAYGRTDLDRSDVTAAAQAARADGFIRRLPLGYRTPLVRAPMSGGERQRLGLARALARPAAVYVLDDATSGLDTVTEAEVVEALTARLDGRTRLVVAHRATTAARCDLVAWLDDGQIRAVGPHVRLWADPDYRAVFGEQPAALGVAAHA